MKIAAYNDEHNLDLGTGGPLVGDQGGIAGGDVAGAWGALSVVGLRRDVSIASNLLPVSVGDVLTIIQASPAVARFATPSNAALSFGSNSTTVAAANAGGAATTASRSDHRHAGIAEITASSSNSMERATVNLRPGTNITFGLSDSDASGALDTITINSTAAGGGSGMTIEEVDGSPTGTVTKLVLPNGTLSIVGSTATYTPAASGSGGHPLDSAYSIDGTYGDHFTGASLSGSWTRRNYTSGAESYQVGPNGTYLRIAKAGRTGGDGYFKTAPAGDWTFAMAFVPRFYGVGAPAWGVAVVDTNGTGVGTCFYTAPTAPLLIQVTTYTTYGGSYVQPGGAGTAPNVNVLPNGNWPDERKVWVYLRKSGTNYYTAMSLDGEAWCPESPALAWAGTVDRVAMMDAPLGTTTSGAGTGSYVDVDWFNKIA